MNNTKNFGIVGGDKRNLFLSKILKEDDHIVKICGFENLDLCPDLNKIYDNLRNIMSNMKYIILPIVPSTDHKTIYAPFSSSTITIDDTLINLLENKIIFCGKKEALYGANNNFKNLTIRDYSSREEFMIFNALPTAEGAISIALKEYDKILSGSNCLITGFGRIGKVLAKLLKAFECHVEISARKNIDLSWIETLGYTPIHADNLNSISKYDLIFNTVPYMVFDKYLLSTCKKETIIIDLASSPGGTDFEYAKENKIKALHTLGLPGKNTPYTAAKIIKKSIYKIIEEENL